LSKSASRARLKDIISKRSFGRGEITWRPAARAILLQPEANHARPEGAALLAELSLDALKDDQVDYIGGLEMGAVPIAGAIAQLSWLKGRPIAAFFVRKKPKEHGARLAVEGLAKGESLAGKRIVIVEDVTTTGGSAIKAVDAVKDAGVRSRWCSPWSTAMKARRKLSPQRVFRSARSTRPASFERLMLNSCALGKRDRVFPAK
jgi:orotate phosphoribosyltransferase